MSLKLKPTKPKWLTVEDAKNRMFIIDKENIIRYVLRHNRVGILETQEELFMEIIFKARTFTKGKYPKYKTKVALCQFDYENKVWIIDREVLTITLTYKDFKWFNAVKVKAGDRIKALCYHYTTPKGLVFRGIGWSMCKRGSPK